MDVYYVGRVAAADSNCCGDSGKEI